MKHQNFLARKLNLGMIDETALENTTSWGSSVHTLLSNSNKSLIQVRQLDLSTPKTQTSWTDLPELRSCRLVQVDIITFISYKIQIKFPKPPKIQLKILQTLNRPLTGTLSSLFPTFAAAPAVVDSCKLLSLSLTLSISFSISFSLYHSLSLSPSLSDFLSLFFSLCACHVLSFLFFFLLNLIIKYLLISC